jgi:hypothetical protein
MQFAPDTVEDHFRHLTQAGKRMALESTSFADIRGTVSGIVPGIVAAVSGIFTSLKIPQDSVELPKEQRKFLEIVNARNYMEMSPLLAYIPEGLDGDFLAYSQALLVSVLHAEKLMHNVLSPYSAFLAGLVTNSDSWKSVMDQTRDLKANEKARDASAKSVMDLINPNSRETETTYGEVINRQGDWAQVIRTLEDYNGRLLKISNTAVVKKVNDCVALLDRLKEMAEEGKAEHATPQVIEALATSALLAAREVEFFSITQYRCRVMNKAVDDTIAHVINVYKNQK